MTTEAQKADPIQSLINKAASQDDGGEAMKFAQAAVNVANALCSIQTAKNLEASK